MAHGLKPRFAQMAALLAAIALVFGLGGCSFSTPSLAEAQDNAAQQTIDDDQLVEAGTLTVAVNTSDVPQVITDSDGNLTGYEIDVASALAENMGLKLSVVHASSASSVLEDNEADLYLGTEASDESDDLTVEGELFENATAVFGVSNGDTDATTVSTSDLSTASVGVQDGSASQDALADIGVTECNTYTNVNECFEALASGEVDYVVCDSNAGGYLARSYEGVYFCGIISEAISYGIGFRADATGLIEDVTSAFDSLSADGTLEAIHQLWYGSVPLNLSSEAVSGVTLSDEDEDDSTADDEDADADGSSGDSDDTSVITEDINDYD